MLKSRAPIIENCKVRGMGVAVRVRVSTLALSVLSLSLTATPNFCSSSITNRPKSLNLTRLPTMAWVPIRMSILPASKSLKVSVFCLAVLKRFK